MKLLLSLLLVAAVVCGTCLGQTDPSSDAAGEEAASASASFAAHPSPYNFPRVQYPRIEADSRVTFRFNAPNAQSVQVSIVSRPFDMVKGDDGVWTYTSEPQAPGYHNYWMIVDGAVVLDPGTNAFIGYGHMCNGFEIPDPEGGFYEIKDVPHGKVLIEHYFSETSNSWRRIFVYTPPDYFAENNTKRYPVLYLQHGGGEDERVWIEMGRTNVILDNLIAEDKINPFIVVMESSAVGGPGGTGGGGRGMGAGRGMGGGLGVNLSPSANVSFVGAAGGGAGRGMGAGGGAGRGMGAGGGAGRGMGGARGAGGGFGGFGGLGGGAFGQLMINDLIPWVDSNFRTLADQPHRAMSGLSMGGMQTRSITLANLDVFSHIGLFSGGTISMNDVNNTEGFTEKVKVVFMSYGSEEGGAGGIQNAANALEQAGVKGVAYVSPGTAHEWQTWRRSLYEFAPLLFQD